MSKLTRHQAKKIEAILRDTADRLLGLEQIRMKIVNQLKQMIPAMASTVTTQEKTIPITYPNVPPSIIKCIELTGLNRKIHCFWNIIFQGDSELSSTIEDFENRIYSCISYICTVIKLAHAPGIREQLGDKVEKFLNNVDKLEQPFRQPIRNANEWVPKFKNSRRITAHRAPQTYRLQFEVRPENCSARFILTNNFDKSQQDLFELLGLLPKLTTFYEAIVHAVEELRATECNGLMTYDRAVIKVDVAKVAAANQGRVPKRKVVVPASQAKGISWRYTFEQPAGDWFKPGFDDSKWKQAPGAFGTKSISPTVVRTEWNTGNIWLRRQFELPKMKTDNLSLLVHHDEDAEIYVNGVLAANAAGYTTTYEELSLTPQGRAALKPGKNLLAVHCKQTTGGQCIDVGIVEVTSSEQ